MKTVPQIFYMHIKYLVKLDTIVVDLVSHTRHPVDEKKSSRDDEDDATGDETANDATNAEGMWRLDQRDLWIISFLMSFRIT